MSDNNTPNSNKNNIIDGVEVTDDTLTSRGGLSLFVRYLRNIGLLPHDLPPVLVPLVKLEIGAFCCYPM